MPIVSSRRRGSSRGSLRLRSSHRRVALRVSHSRAPRSGWSPPVKDADLDEVDPRRDREDPKRKRR